MTVGGDQDLFLDLYGFDAALRSCKCFDAEDHAFANNATISSAQESAAIAQELSDHLADEAKRTCP